MVKVLKLNEKGGFLDEQGKEVNLSQLELKLALTRPSSIGEIRRGKIFEGLMKFGDKIGADYVFFTSDGYTGGQVTTVDIINATNHHSNISVNYYCKKQ